MVPEYNVTSYILNEQYEIYNRNPINWDRHYEILAEKADREYEDSLFEEED